MAEWTEKRLRTHMAKLARRTEIVRQALVRGLYYLDEYDRVCSARGVLKQNPMITLRLDGVSHSVERIRFIAVCRVPNPQGYVVVREHGGTITWQEML